MTSQPVPPNSAQDGPSTDRALRDRVLLAEDLLGDRARRGVSIGALTTYRVGGAAELFVEVSSVDDLAAVSAAVQASGLPTLVVGKGSNLLVADAGFSGLAIMLTGMDAISFAGDISEPTSEVVVRAEAMASLPVVARKCCAQGLSGFEWAVGVPGSIGGAVRMNAGGHGSDMAASLSRIRRWTLSSGEDEMVSATELDLSYRSSNVSSDHVVVYAELELAPGDAERCGQELKEIVRWRRANQPGGQNAGSVFTNPEGDSAGRLIDAAGCKGLRHGSAEVSTKHANFIQADSDGSADDIAALMRLVQNRVQDTFGVDLHAETRVVGEFG